MVHSSVFLCIVFDLKRYFYTTQTTNMPKKQLKGCLYETDILYLHSINKVIRLLSYQRIHSACNLGLLDTLIISKM